MKTVRWMFLAIIGFVLVCCCSACSQKKQSDDQVSDSNISFAAEFTAPGGVYDGVCMSLVCVPDKLNYTIVSQMLMLANDNITVEHSDKTSRTGEAYIMYEFAGDAGTGYYSENTGSFRYCTAKGETICNLVSLAAQIDPNKIYESEAISQIEIDGITAIMSSMFEEMRLETHAVLPLTQKVLNEMNEGALPVFKQMEQEGFPIQYSTQYTTEDECYYVLMRPQYSNVALYQNEFWPANGVGNGISAPWIQLVVSARGVEFVEVSNMWDVQETNIQGKVMPYNSACDKYREYHQQLIGEEDIIVSGISLAYVPVMVDSENYTEVVEYRIAYVFESNNGYRIEAFDAVTGEVLSWVE